jgi:hypothetical protein
VIGDRDDADGEAARRAGMRFCKVDGIWYQGRAWPTEAA